MRKKRNILLAILLAAILGSLIWFIFTPHELVYSGKTLSVWLQEMEDWDGDTNYPAYIAFQNMGSNAIPALLSVIESGGSRLQKLTFQLNQKQSIVHLPGGTPWRQEMGATWALYAMGTNAAPTFQVFTNWLLHTNKTIPSAIVLAGIGSEAIPTLIAALTNQERRIRHSAASGLAWARSDVDLIIPALIARLSDRDATMQYMAASSLGQIHARPDIAVPALIKNLSSTDPLLRGTILISLGLFEGKALEALPVIMVALKDPDPLVRQSAGFALKQIDPEAAAKAGVK